MAPVELAKKYTPFPDPTRSKGQKLSPNVLIADFVVTTPKERDYELSRALKTARFKADMGGKLGVLVTRHDFSRFSVSLTTAVPYGSIHELDHARRRPQL